MGIGWRRPLSGRLRRHRIPSRAEMVQRRWAPAGALRLAVSPTLTLPSNASTVGARKGAPAPTREVFSARCSIRRGASGSLRPMQQRSPPPPAASSRRASPEEERSASRRSEDGRDRAKNVGPTPGVPFPHGGPCSIDRTRWSDRQNERPPSGAPFCLALVLSATVAITAAGCSEQRGRNSRACLRSVSACPLQDGTREPRSGLCCVLRSTSAISRTQAAPHATSRAPRRSLFLRFR